MVASVRAVGTVDSATPWAPGLPSGWQPGDVCYLICETIATESVAATGWTHVTGSPVTATGGCRLHVLERRMQAGDTAPTVTGPSDHAVTRIVGVMGVPAAGDVKGFVNVGSETAANSSAEFPGGTTPEDNCLILEIIATGRDASSTTNLGTLTNAAYSDITERMDNWVTTGGGGGIGCVSALKATAGATGSSAATMGSTDGKALMTIAIKSAPPADPPDPTGEVELVDSTTSGNTTNTTSKAVAVPAGATTMDVVAVHLSRWTNPTPGATMPPGFVHRGQVVAGDQALDVFLKRCTDDESGSYTFTWTADGSRWNTAQAMLYRGVDRDVDLTTLRLNSATGSGTSVPTTALTGVPDGAALDWHVVNESGGGTKTFPSPWTKVEENDCDGTAYQAAATAGDYTASGATVGASSDSLIATLLELPPEPADGGLTGTAAQASEADTATTLTKRKTKAVGQPSASDTATAVTARKARPVGKALVADTATALVERKARALGQAVASDTAGAITGRKSKTIGQATDTATARPVTPATGHTVGQAVETETATALAPVKRSALVQAADTSAATAVGEAKRRTLAQAAATDTASVLAEVKRRTVSTATETGAAAAVTERKTRPLVAATETDTARDIIRPGQVAKALEADTAQPLGERKTRPVSQAGETDIAGTMTARKALVVGSAVDIHVAGDLGELKRKAIGQASETDTAIAVPHGKTRPLTSATETATARPITGAGQIAILERAVETNVAFVIVHRRTTPRPDAGVTLRPSSGTTENPDDGTTTSGSSGITARPFTGVTPRP